MYKTSVLKHLVIAPLVLAFTVPEIVYADPPPWAPAHGYRKKHDPNYVGYTGTKWEKDYGILEGRCNRGAIGAVVGGVVGGAVGSTIGKGDGKTVAIIIGTVLGAAIGAKVGNDIDEADRACFGHALELAGDNKRVIWTNDDNGVRYQLTPLAGFKEGGRACREYITEVTYNRKTEKQRGVACRGDNGEWRVKS